MNSQPTNVEEIILALQQLGGEAQAKDIKDRVTLNRGGIPPQYGRSHSYRETIQKIIEDYCRESANFRGVAYFKRTGWGRYRLIAEEAPIPASPSSESEASGNRERLSVDEGGVENPEEAWVASEEDDEEAFPEGKEVYRLHRTRERNVKVVDLAKKIRLKKDPLLRCEICSFSFLQAYGELGETFIEAHHTLPLSCVGEGETRLEDIALVCSNCHKMLHRRRPWLGISELRTLLQPEKEG